MHYKQKLDKYEKSFFKFSRTVQYIHLFSVMFNDFEMKAAKIWIPLERFAIP